jgi:diguanylate cyclase (GGDEF)-like protein
MEPGPGRASRPLTSPRAVWWLAALGCAFVGGYLLLPDGRWQSVAWSAFGFGAVGLMVAGVVLNKPAKRWPWWALIAGVALANVADAMVDSTDFIDWEWSDPGWPDLVYLVVYGPLLAGVYGLLARGTRREDRDNSLDAVILALGAAALGYVLLVRPMLNDAAAEERSGPSIAVALGYLALDLLVLAFLCRLALGGLRRNPAVWWTCVGMAFWLAGDLASVWLADPPHPLADLLEELWLAAYWGLALGTLHPAMTRIGTQATAPHRPPSGPRLVLLSLAGVLNPVLVVIIGHRAGPSGGLGVALVVLGCSGALLFCVVGLRMWLLVAASARHIDQLAAALDAKLRLETTLRRMALSDPLTELANRAAFTEVVTRGLRAAPRGLLVMIDLDGFKEVNDTLGHAAGDQLLIAAGLRLNRTLRADDTLARLGGDEFAAWLPDVLSEERARQTADRLTACCREPFSVRAGQATVTASVGAALAHPGDGVDSLLARADHAMYQAKRAGKNNYVLGTSRPGVLHAD